MPASTELLGVLIRELSPALVQAATVELSRKNITRLETIQKEYLAGATVVNMAEGLKVKVAKCPACAAKMDAARSEKKVLNLGKHEHETPNEPDCPTCKHGAPRAVIGRRTWQLLHSTADAFPVEPTQQEADGYKEFMLNMVSSFPCKSCADDAMGYLSSNPLDFSSRLDLQSTTCSLHNHVNGKLGKPIHACPA
jgi:FAD-linked sulfhydryl oxidase